MARNYRNHHTDRSFYAILLMRPLRQLLLREIAFRHPKLTGSFFTLITISGNPPHSYQGKIILTIEYARGLIKTRVALRPKALVEATAILEGQSKGLADMWMIE